MPGLFKKAGPGKEKVFFYGRVRDRSGNFIEGSPVMLLGSAESGEVCLGYTFSTRQGFYMISIERPELDKLAGLRVVAGASSPPDSGSAPAPDRETGRHLFYPQKDRGFIAECRTINHRQLEIIAGNKEFPVSFLTIPESLRVSVSTRDLFGVTVCRISGSGYICSEWEEGEGSFSLVACTMGEGVNEQEMIRVRICPRDPGKKSLYFDSSPFCTDIF